MKNQPHPQTFNATLVKHSETIEYIGKHELKGFQTMLTNPDTRALCMKNFDDYCNIKKLNLEQNPSGTFE